jgi:hypothetical protein
MKRIAILAAFQVLTILGWAGYNEHVWATAPTFKVPLRPRDPFDLVRGRYFVLNPQDATIVPGSGPLSSENVERLLAGQQFFAGTVEVGFCPSGDLHRVCALARPGQARDDRARFWSHGFATISKAAAGWSVGLDLGLHRFFIPSRLELPARENEEGWQLEVCHRPGLSPLPRRLFFKGTAIDLR